MLRKDGVYLFYMIQHSQDGIDWTYSSLDYFGHPKGFTASDKCWQQTGMHGTFDRQEAIDGCCWISERHPKVKFRVVVVAMSQIARPILHEGK